MSVIVVPRAFSHHCEPGAARMERTAPQLWGTYAARPVEALAEFKRQDVGGAGAIAGHLALAARASNLLNRSLEPKG
jgi:hypothetical protein